MACGNSRPDLLGNTIGTGVRPTGTNCSVPNQGCPCPSDGQVAPCGSVDKVVGTFVQCSMGERTCSAGVWGACQGDLTTQSQTTALSTEDTFVNGTLHILAGGASTDAGGGCATNPCDPYCNGVNTAGGVATPEPGFLVADAGLTLASGDGGSGATICTALTIAAASATMTVTAIGASSVTTSPSVDQFTPTYTPAVCAAAGTQPTWTVDRSDVATIDTNGKLQVFSPYSGPLKVTAYYATSSGLLTSNVVTVTVNVAVIDCTGVVGTDTASTATQQGTYLVGPGCGGAFKAGTVASTVNWLYPYVTGPTSAPGTPPTCAAQPSQCTYLPLGMTAPVIQYSWASGSSSAVLVSLRYPAGSTAATATFNYALLVQEKTPISASTSATTPTNGAQIVFPQPAWQGFERTAQGNDATIVIQRWSGSGALEFEKAGTLHFVNGQLKGTIYYQSYATNLTHLTPYTTILGAPFGAATLAITPGGAAPTVAAGASTSDDSGCRVCHKVSAQGTVLLTQQHPSSEVGTHSYDLTMSPPVDNGLMGGSNDGRYAWSALSPDGTYIFANSGPLGKGTTPELEGDKTSSTVASALYTVSTGATIGGTTNMPTNLNATMPNFSPDGAQLAFNFWGGSAAPLTYSGSATAQKTLAAMQYNSATKTFSNFKLLNTPASGSAYWPSFLPDGSGVVFERETRANGRDIGGTRGDTDPPSSNPAQGALAELWWVSAGVGTTITGAGATPTAFALKNLNGNGGALPAYANALDSADHSAALDATYNYEPTVNPTLVGGLAWVAFTSRRIYGNIATLNPYSSDPRYIDISKNPTPRKLWIAAVDPTATTGTDASHPAFYVPGQELLSSNARAYWVLPACGASGATCDTDLDCCSGTSCRIDIGSNPTTRHCRLTSMCQAAGGTCKTDADCCGGAKCSNDGTANPSGACTSVSPGGPVYTTSTYSQDYQASCPSGTAVVWQLFEYQAIVPSGQSISFSAETSSSAGAYDAGAAVAIGQATVTTPAGLWTVSSDTNGNPQTVDTALKNVGQRSLSYLRILMTFNTTGSASATLTNWQVFYDCLPSE